MEPKETSVFLREMDRQNQIIMNYGVHLIEKINKDSKLQDLQDWYEVRTAIHRIKDIIRRESGI